MLPKTDVERLLELYKSTDKQTTELLEIIKIVSENNQKNTDLIQRQINIIEYLSEENVKQNFRIMNLEMQIKELKNANNL